MNILLVDDNKEYLNSFSEFLRRLLPDAGIDAALGGQEAIEKIVESNPDIVLSDLRMPFVDGKQVAQFILKRRWFRRPCKSKIIIHTSGESAKSLQSLINMGVHGLLFKTFKEDTLVMCLSAVVSGKKYISLEVKEFLAAKPMY